MKIAWICHFSTSEIRKHLNIEYHSGLSEFALWIPAAISGFEALNDADLSLHVISPHPRLRKSVSTFQLRGINYHFFKSDIPLVHRNWKNIPVLFRKPLFPKYWSNRLLIKRIVKSIKPDIISVWGAENPYYSISALDMIKKYPVIVILQGIYSDQNARKFHEEHIGYDQYRATLEKKIHASCRYFGSAVQFMSDLVLQDNPGARIFNIDINRTALECADPDLKEYDIVFFARLDKIKGIEDLLHALKLAKQTRPDITLRIIGPQNDRNYALYIQELIKLLDLGSNVSILGPIAQIEDLYSEVSRARISVLPTYIDGLPNTITESIFLGIPVISYNTGLIPSLNNGEERIVILDKGDVEGLAESIVELLENPDLRASQAKKARDYLVGKVDNKKNAMKLMDIYKQILEIEKG